MSAVANVLRELVGLIIDDGHLALWIVSVIAIAAVVSHLPGAVLAAGGILLVGCATALIASVIVAARR